MRADRVTVIGAGIGGLAAAVDLASKGLDVTVIERAAAPGGKMRQVEIDGRMLDAGPTVFTMRHVFDQIFADAGSSLSAHLTLKPVDILARHAWSDGSRLDLHADINQSADAIGRFAGAGEAQGYLDFCERSKRIYETLADTFIHASRPTPFSLTRRVGASRPLDLLRISPFASLWSALGEHFRNPRLRQLFGRYATYSGSSPFLAPATLMLIAHVERDGVWLVEGGMHRIAASMAELAETLGVTFRYNQQVAAIETARDRLSGVRLSSGERIGSEAVIVNADAAALAGGCFGAAAARAVPAIPPKTRSLSAVTWSLVAETSGFPLARHSIFFSDDYKAEFREILGDGRLPTAPTIYVCAQDRDDAGYRGETGCERLLCLINAPPHGDTTSFSNAEIDACTNRVFAFLERCGLTIDRRTEATVTTTPRDFEALFPATGGALYGQASHGWQASFRRPGSRTKIPGLYLAGGSAHPGAGVPMAALSGRLAAAALVSDLASTSRLVAAAMPGGMSMA